MRNAIENIIFEIMKKSSRELRKRIRFMKMKNTQFTRKRA